MSTPQTGEKRKRGRPSKNPADATPKPVAVLKRGRGRPRKEVSEADLATATPATPSEGPKRGRGRPRKEPAAETLIPTPQNSGPDSPRKSLPVATSAAPEATPKRGPGRPRKSLPATTNEAPAVTPKKGPGRPRKSLPATTNEAQAATPKKGPGRPRKSLPATTNEAPAVTPKKGPGRPRKSLPASTDEPLGKPPKQGRGRPRKHPLAEPGPETIETKSKPTMQSESKPDIERSYWLMKAEPESRLEKGVDVKFSIDDLAAAKEPEPWDGVRNPVARNIMRDMKKGDQAFFYHSNCKVPGIVGTMEIVQEHSVDESAFDPKHPYYDPKSKRDDPKWVVVHVEFRRKLNKQVTLADLKANAQPGKPLENLQTLKQSRLSVSSVTPAQWQYILELAGEE